MRSLLRRSNVPMPPLLHGAAHDLRVAARLLWASPVVTVVAVLSLALGIGANTALFSLVDHLVLRATPVRDPARIAVLTETGRAEGIPSRYGYPVWDEIRRRRDLFDGVLAWSLQTPLTLTGGGASQPVDGVFASGSFFDVLGVHAERGRTFGDADDPLTPGSAGADPVAVISDELWRSRFGGAADIVGRTVTIDRLPVTIVGVLPRAFHGLEVGRTLDVMLPIGVYGPMTRRDLRDGTSGTQTLQIAVREKHDQSIAAAAAALRAVQPDIRIATMPANWPSAVARDLYLKTPFNLTPLTDINWSVRRRYERPLVTILAVAALVLLIACANVANLLLARATARAHELSIRCALGASRWRLVRQLAAESALLAGISGVMGAVAATWGSRVLLQRISTAENPVFLDLALDWRLVLFATAVASAAVLLFGVAPAVRASRVAPLDALKQDGRASVSTRGGMAAGLVVLQVALSLVLVVTAGLLARTFATLAARDLGFQSSHVLVVRVDTQPAEVTPTARPALYERMLERVRGIPGVVDAGLSVMTPIAADRPMLGQPIDEISGVGRVGMAAGPSALNAISSGWFRALGIPLVEGRDFAASDRLGAAPVAIVNQTFVRRFMHGIDPIGHTLKILLPGPPRPPLEIVGLCADAAYGSMRGPMPATMYLPVTQLGDVWVPFLASANLTVRVASGSPLSIAKEIDAAVAGVNRDVGTTFNTLDNQIATALTQERLVATLSTFFGVLALLLAALGLYGVTAYAAARRRNEIAIRMALGAGRSHVLRVVVGRLGVLVGLGIAIGVAFSFSTASLVRSLLYGVGPRDPFTVAGAAGVLAATAAIAAWIPARRAARTDPAIALRSE